MHRQRRYDTITWPAKRTMNLINVCMNSFKTVQYIFCSARNTSKIRLVSWAYVEWREIAFRWRRLVVHIHNSYMYLDSQGPRNGFARVGPSPPVGSWTPLAEAPTAVCTPMWDRDPEWVWWSSADVCTADVACSRGDRWWQCDSVDVVWWARKI